MVFSSYDLIDISLAGAQEKHPGWVINEEQMEDVALRLLEIQEYEKCEKWCDRIKLLHPSTLPAYTCRLKLLFNMGRREEFFDTIEELKASSVVIDKETLELIRVFRKE